MAEQARLDVEGYHLDLLNYNFRGWPRVNFPRTIYATQTIVIESFETGEVVGDLLKGLSSSDNRVSPQLASFIVTLGESLYLKMLLVDNLMHADLHPGNILVDMTGLEEDKFKLTLVDAGMVAQLNEVR
jgi:aarF domain-containing kinase